MELQDFLSKLSLPQDFTRRGFLKATSVMAAIGMMNQARAASGVRPYIVLETAKGILICDPNLCVACHRCELACTEFNEGKADPRLARIKITRNVMFGHAGTNVYPPTKGIWGDGIVVQDTCRQCAHPTPCANACPQGAIVVDPKTGARRVDKHRLPPLRKGLPVGHDDLRRRGEEGQQVLPLRRGAQVRQALSGRRHPLRALDGPHG